jgi:hypothetical protein
MRSERQTAAQQAPHGLRKVEHAPITKELEALLAPLSPEELARRQAVVAEIRALREQIPPISPLTAAELVHLGREDTISYAEESSSE